MKTGTTSKRIVAIYLDVLLTPGTTKTEILKIDSLKVYGACIGCLHYTPCKMYFDLKDKSVGCGYWIKNDETTIPEGKQWEEDKEKWYLVDIPQTVRSQFSNLVSTQPDTALMSPSPLSQQTTLLGQKPIFLSTNKDGTIDENTESLCFSCMNTCPGANREKCITIWCINYCTVPGVQKVTLPMLPMIPSKAESGATSS